MPDMQHGMAEFAYFDKFYLNTPATALLPEPLYTLVAFLLDSALSLLLRLNCLGKSYRNLGEVISISLATAVKMRHSFHP